MQIERGTVFGHRYVVQSQVGTGGMATVYRGTDRTLDRLVAIKVMLERYAQDPSFAARFKQEAQAAAALQSPYIVSVYDWGQEGDTYYIIMEYLHGTDLKTGIRSHGALAPRKVAQIGAQVCQALSVAHAHDIIHRDIKPQNIMIQPNGDAKVMDFGIARSKNSHLTQTNSVLGTAHYVSPEQAQGKELGPTSDLYSLGVVMYEAATGHLPFDGDDAVSVALKQVNEEPIPPNEVNPNIDDDLNAIIMKCMMKNPAERFQTADELRRVLNNYIMGRPINLGGTTTVLTGVAGVRPAVNTDRTTPLPINGARAVGMTPAVSINNSTPYATVNQHHSGIGRNGNVASQSADSTSQLSNAEGGRHGLPAGAIVAIIAVVVIIAIIAVVLGLGSCSSNTDTITDNTGTSTSATTGSTAQNASSANTVTVPSVTGMTVAEATEALQAAGLSVGTQSNQSSSTVAKGNIISQNPTANQSVESGTKVSLVVSTGAENVTLPDNLIGLSESDFSTTLRSLGLKVSHDSSLDDYSDTYDTDVVISIGTLASGQEVAQGTTVSYGLSLGPAPITIPTITGLNYSDAEYALANVGIYNYNENWVDNDSYDRGIVISADPTDGTQVTSGTSVTLTISNGPQVQVPDVTGWAEADAENYLVGMGLAYSVSYQNSDSVESGRVISVSPSAGTLVDSGSSVTLTVSQGASGSTTSGDSGNHSTMDTLVGGTVDNAKNVIVSQGYWWRVNGLGSTVTGISIDSEPSSDGHTYVTITTN